MRVYKFLTAHFALKTLYERRLKISILEDLNDPFELIPYDLSNKTHREEMHRARDKICRSNGMMCFSADWHNPVIWAHYADKHRGICLGFEVPEDTAGCVVYIAKRLPFPTPPLSIEHSKKMLFTKYTSWEYEKEIRIWARLKEEEDGLYFKDFDDKLRLVEVIVGARCTVPKSAIVRAIAPFTTEINLIKARAGFRKFEIVTKRARA
jgi:hypothetical protein